MEKVLAKDAAVYIDDTPDRGRIAYLDVTKPPLKLHGLYFGDGFLRRAPLDVAAATSENVKNLAEKSAGGRVRFKVSGAEFIKIKLESPELPTSGSAHNGTIGLHGIDLYKDGCYNQVTFPHSDEYVFGRWWGEDEEPTVTLHLPLSRKIKRLLLGFPENAVITEAPDYSLTTPIVFYGSSITQGNCSARPGMSYQNILARRLDFDYINLGFAGAAKGEDAIADYIASLDMSIFVYDYDHNAPNPEHLRKTHEKLFLKVREAHPDLPIVIITRPRPAKRLSGDVLARQTVIKETYDRAIARGDENVYFIPGTSLISDDIGDDWSCDGTHPTDLGFFSMANAIEPTLKKLIEQVKERGIK